MAEINNDKVNNRIRVLLVDDHPLVRIGVRMFLARQPDFEVAGEAADGAEAMRKAGQLRPDVVLLDIKMPRMDGFAVARWLEEKFPQTRVVMLSSCKEPKHVAQSIDAGARGYVRKDGSLSDLLLAFRRVSAGQTHFPSEGIDGPLVSAAA